MNQSNNNSINNASDFLEINGSLGEGGGQIIRSSLSLSLVTGRSIRITKIRAGRKKPGLLKQHLTAVSAAAEVGQAEIEGVELGAKELTFKPTGVFSGKYNWEIGSAGSTTLVAQTVLPALLMADQPSQITIRGGTHNSMAPPFDFLEQSYLPLLNQMGPRVHATLERYGFYPAGGGKLTLQIHPAPLRGFDLLERGELLRTVATAVVANLPVSIADRELNTVRRKLEWDKTAELKAVEAQGLGPGNAVMIRYEYKNVTEMVTGFGQQGVSAERVAADAVRELRNYLRCDAAVGEYLTDQWLLLVALAVWQTGQTHYFTCLPLSSHATTHIQIIQYFLGVETTSERLDSGACKLTLRRASEETSN
ncbi:MAG: RNA 3'-terminal phosphate cyclase [Planctomycetaceae bacterium]|nr:RNA 3'-terminal phosphate cyclase [Planctomycetaceae bacterium]